MNTPSLDVLPQITLSLRRLGIEHIFTGGLTLALHLDEPQAGDLRATRDVDVIVAVRTWSDFAAIEASLRSEGWQHDASPGAPMCRWAYAGCVVDVMPADGAAVGLRTLWFREALQAPRVLLMRGEQVPVIAPEFFVATKIEAFRDRGGRDFLASRDLEDLVAVVNGCSSLARRVRESDPVFRDYIATQFAALIKEPGFIEALPAHLPPDAASQSRLERLRTRLQQLAGAAT